MAAAAHHAPVPHGTDVVVVGGGPAGLAAAAHLTRAGCAVHVLEKDSEIGGRLRTDMVDGFRLDRGFHVLFTAYPEARRILDYTALDLRAMPSGSMVHAHGRFVLLVDSRRRPADASSAMLTSVATLGDGVRLLRLMRRAHRRSLEGLLAPPQTTSAQMLRDAGFSKRLTESFFRPFAGTRLLDRELETASGMLQFFLRMLADGDAALPALGIQAIPEQLAARLPAGSVSTDVAVTAVRPDGEQLRIFGSAGELCRARAVVVATDCPLPGATTAIPPAVGWRSATYLYFDAPRPPLEGGWVLLDGDGAGPVDSGVVLSEVTPTYAPPRRALVSATVLRPFPDDDAALEAAVREQLSGWFGEQVAAWRLLRVYRILRGIPVFGVAQAAAVGPATERALDRLPRGVFACGDRFDTPTLNGALASARRAAERAAAFLGHRVPTP